jgi:hypothetical protein
MSNTFLWVVLPLALTSAIYAILAAGYFLVQHRIGMCAAFSGYLIANCGLIYDAMMWRGN